MEKNLIDDNHNIKYSVLMSLYFKESPEHLIEALDSIFSQTIVSDDIILVEDGKIGEELENVVYKYATNYPQLHVVRFKYNRGLGYALNDGLKECRHEYVARMDTDDIAKCDRMQKQLAYLDEHPNIDVVGTWVDEFFDDTKHILSSRKLPEEAEEIYRLGKKKNPMNHPTVMFRKSAVLAAGGYKHFLLFEDYYLWVRMLMNGNRLANIQDSLLYFRTSPQMMKRRGGIKYALVEMHFFITLYKMGYTNMIETIANIARRFPVRIMPNCVRNFIYRKIIRKE